MASNLFAFYYDAEGNPVKTLFSGNMVNVASGQVQVMSGTVTVSGNVVNTSVSGNWLNITSSSIAGFSGLAVSTTVQTNVSGNVVVGETSGQVTRFVSGHNLVQMQSGFNQVLVSGFVSVSGNAVTTSVSGNVVVTSVSGNVVSATVNSNVSGNVVVAEVSGQIIRTTSGHNLVQMQSGFNHVLVSGFVSVSGNSVSTSVSGNVINTSISGNIVQISGQAVTTTVNTNISGQVVVAETSGQVERIASIQGSGIHSASDLSGINRLLASVSGQPVSTSVSGNVVVANAVTSVSGNVVVAEVSGQTVRTFAASGQNGIYLTNQAGTVPSVLTGTTDTLGNNSLLFVAAHMLVYNRSVSQWARPEITQSGQGLSGVAHKFIVALSGDPVTTSVSGNAIVTSVSGNVVVAEVSGQTIAFPLSGSNVVQLQSGAARVVLGDDNSTANVTIGAIASDANDPASQISVWTHAQMGGYDPVSARYVRTRVTASGAPSTLSGITNKLIVAFSGDPVTTSVSGNVVVTSVSGNVVVSTATADISGQTVRTFAGSGQNSVYLSNQAQTQAVTVGTPNTDFSQVNQSLFVLNTNYGFDPTAGRWVRIITTASGTPSTLSGITNKLVVGFSGDSVITSISGNVVVAENSGQSVTISGNFVRLSPGGTVSVSGNVVESRATTTVRVRDLLPVADTSGGTILASGDCISVTIRNIEASGNPLYIGGIGTEAPYSGHGFFLQGGDGITLNVTNFNQIRVVAAGTSGKKVSYLGVQY